MAESITSRYDELYYYSVNADREITMKKLHKYKLRGLGYGWRDDSGRNFNVTWSDIDEFKNNRVILTSADIEKAKEIITKRLFKRMLKAQEDYNRANDKYIKFREANK